MNTTSSPLTSRFSLKVLLLAGVLAIGFAPTKDARAQWATFDFLNNVGQANQLAQLYQEYRTLYDQYRKVKQQYQIADRNIRRMRSNINTTWDAFREVRSLDDAFRAVETLDYTLRRAQDQMADTFPEGWVAENFEGARAEQASEYYGVLQGYLESARAADQRIIDGIRKAQEIKRATENVGGALEAAQNQTNATLRQTQSINMLRKEINGLGTVMGLSRMYDQARKRQADRTASNRIRGLSGAEFEESDFSYSLTGD